MPGPNRPVTYKTENQTGILELFVVVKVIEHMTGKRRAANAMGELKGISQTVEI